MPLVFYKYPWSVVSIQLSILDGSFSLTLLCRLWLAQSLWRKHVTALVIIILPLIDSVPWQFFVNFKLQTYLKWIPATTLYSWGELIDNALLINSCELAVDKGMKTISLSSNLLPSLFEASFSPSQIYTSVAFSLHHGQANHLNKNQLCRISWLPVCLDDFLPVKNGSKYAYWIHNISNIRQLLFAVALRNIQFPGYFSINVLLLEYKWASITQEVNSLQ